jgi:protein prenyltransferase alpha subunit repeat containing protein 1
MSRALDPDTASSILTGTPLQVYEDIVKALCYNPSPALFEVELLGNSHELPPGCSVLVDENYIGVPKKKLVQAFVIGRGIFFKGIEDFQHANHQDIRNATAVILLMDPENLTAANTRKRLIQACQKQSASELKKALKEELHWVDSMLTSRLHRHTKSPTLWDHRRWVVLVCQSVQIPEDLQRDLNEVVLVAAERHPRNYYAWLHMRWLLQNSYKDTTDIPVKRFDEASFLSIIQDWCLKHPSDTSGLSFLLFFLLQLPSSSKSRVETNSSVCKEVLRLSVSFQWNHESVWVFMRTLVASGQITPDQRTAFFQSIEGILGSQPEDSKSKLTLAAARDWCLRYEQKQT